MNGRFIPIRANKWALLAWACVLAMALCLVVLPEAAWANKVISAPTTVSDDITRLNVAKLDADTHEYVMGATMAIISKSGGETVDEWVTDGTVHVNEQGLDVNVTYILREVSAPDGYEKAPDVEFVLNEIEGTGITVCSDAADTWELTEPYKITVYDSPMLVEKEKIVHKKREKTQTVTKSTTTKGDAPKTGDDPVLPIVLASVAVLALLVVLIARKRRNRE